VFSWTHNYSFVFADAVKQQLSWKMRSIYLRAWG